MIPAEGTDGIDDLIDLLQGFSVHALVEFLEVGFDGCVIEAVGFVIGIEQHLQDTLRIVGIVLLLGSQVGLEGSHKLIHEFLVLERYRVMVLDQDVQCEPHARYRINDKVFDPVRIHVQTRTDTIPLNYIAVRDTNSFKGSTVEFV